MSGPEDHMEAHNLHERLQRSEHTISHGVENSDRATFMRELLSDVRALEVMLKEGLFEKEMLRIGAEQEYVLVDSNCKPSGRNLEILSVAQESRLSTELAKFDLEANVTPLTLSAGALSCMENELKELTSKARSAAAEFSTDVLLTGILPTLRLSDLSRENMTDIPRYHQLDLMLGRLRRSNFLIHIKGVDEIHLTHGNMMLEACNTSFQLHMQTDPTRFANFYNIAQLISAPVLAAAVNSPLLFGKRLWAETRLALFQHSVDERSSVEQIRDRSPRVSFGDRWLHGSIVELFRQDIARFRILLTCKVEEDPFEVLAQGGIPRLRALSVHNGTIWRWNRPCYGVTNDRPHLRIESRFLPAGPTILDEVANAAFFFGLMISLAAEYEHVDRVMKFNDAKANFFAAARNGLNTQLYWLNGKIYPAQKLILDHLLPMAEAGLRTRGVEAEEIHRYLDVIHDRVESGQTGSQWILKSFESFDRGTLDMRLRALTNRMREEQDSGRPVHEWSLESLPFGDDYQMNYGTVDQYMSTALFTVRPDDIVDYVASIMHWEHIRHVPVEEEDGSLVGLVSQSDLIVLLAHESKWNRAGAVPVSEIMKKKIVTVTPETTTADAIDLMKRNQIGCLPVIKDGRVIGIITTYDILGIASKLLEKRLVQGM